MAHCFICRRLGAITFPRLNFHTVSEFYWSILRILLWFYIFDIAINPMSNDQIIQFALCAQHVEDGVPQVNEARRNDVNYFPNDVGMTAAQRQRRANAVAFNANQQEPQWQTTMVIPDVVVDASAQRIPEEIVEAALHKFLATSNVLPDNQSYTYLALDSRFLDKLLGDYVSINFNSTERFYIEF